MNEQEKHAASQEERKEKIRAGDSGIIGTTKKNLDFTSVSLA